MGISDEHIDQEELRAATRCGNDSTPLMAYVPEPPPAHWGKLTSTPRTASPAYIAFLKKHREVQDGQSGKR